MGYRVRMVAEVRYGEFGAYLGTVRELAAVAEKRGWAPMRVLVPTVGRNNEIVIESDYPDLATYQRENEAFYADEEAFAAFRSGAPYIVQGTSRTELYEDMPAAFPAG